MGTVYSYSASHAGSHSFILFSDSLAVLVHVDDVIGNAHSAPFLKQSV